MWRSRGTGFYSCAGQPYFSANSNGLVLQSTVFISQIFTICIMAISLWYKHLINPCNVCTHFNWSVAHSFFQPYVLFFRFFRVAFVHSGVVNGLSRLVSVSRHFLIDTNGLYITHVMCANTWKSQLKCHSFFFIAKHKSLFRIWARIWTF